MEGSVTYELLQFSLDAFSDNLKSVFRFLSMSPQEFRSGEIFSRIMPLAEALKGVSYGLFTLFFLVGIIREFSSFREILQKEAAIRILVRFSLGKVLIDCSTELMLAVTDVGRGIISIVLQGAAEPEALTLPGVICDAIDELSFLESVPVFIVGLICTLIVWVLSVKMILTVYGRFFKIYLYFLAAPLILSTVSGAASSRYASSFIRSFIALSLEGIVMALTIFIFTSFAVTAPDPGSSGAFIMVARYMGAVIFNLLILNSFMSSSDAVVSKMLN